VLVAEESEMCREEYHIHLPELNS